MKQHLIFILKQGQVSHPELVIYLTKLIAPYIVIWLFIGAIFWELAHLFSAIFLVYHIFFFKNIEKKILYLVDTNNLEHQKNIQLIEKTPHQTTEPVTPNVAPPPLPRRYIQISLLKCQEYGILDPDTQQLLTQAKVNTMQKRTKNDIIFSKEANAHFAPIDALTSAGYIITNMPLDYLTWNGKKIIKKN